MLIRGDKLSAKVRQHVLAAFIYRWTVENPNREFVWRKLAKPTMPLISDEQWLREHAFHVTKAGQLDDRVHHAEPAYMADTPGERYTRRCLLEV